MTERLLDWAPRFDERSLDYKIDKLNGVVRKKTWTVQPSLDQGSEGACVGFGFTQMMNTTPKAHQPAYGAQDALDLYHLAQTLDDIPGENYSGTSVLAGAKAESQDANIKSYHWATTLMEVAQAIGTYGPVVIGVRWYEGMDQLDDQGYINPFGALRGGHCVQLYGVDPSTSTFLGQNSWGTKWGANGTFKLRYRDMQRLMNEGAEVCLLRKSRA